MKTIEQDAELIAKLGGPSALARLLGPECSKQRVHNWLTRGIPAAVKLRHPELFLTLNGKN
jgi:hypothetical protein